MQPFPAIESDLDEEEEAISLAAHSTSAGRNKIQRKKNKLFEHRHIKQKETSICF